MGRFQNMRHKERIIPSQQIFFTYIWKHFSLVKACFFNNFFVSYSSKVSSEEVPKLLQTFSRSAGSRLQQLRLTERTASWLLSSSSSPPPVIQIPRNVKVCFHCFNICFLNTYQSIFDLSSAGLCVPPENTTDTWTGLCSLKH